MSRGYRNLAKQWMRGTAGQQRVPKDFFEQWLLAIPPDEIRIKVGNIMRLFDDSISKIQSHIKKQHILLNKLREEYLSLI